MVLGEFHVRHRFCAGMTRKQQGSWPAAIATVRGKMLSGPALPLPAAREANLMAHLKDE